MRMNTKSRNNFSAIEVNQVVTLDDPDEWERLYKSLHSFGKRHNRKYKKSKDVNGFYLERLS